TGQRSGQMARITRHAMESFALVRGQFELLKIRRKGLDRVIYRGHAYVQPLGKIDRDLLGLGPFLVVMAERRDNLVPPTFQSKPGGFPLEEVVVCAWRVRLLRLALPVLLDQRWEARILAHFAHPPGVAFEADVVSFVLPKQ